MKGTAMSDDRKVAVWVGVLYIVATVAPVSGLSAWGTLTDGAGILTNANANEGQMILTLILNLTMAVAVAGVAFMLYPILRRVADTAVKKGLALWYVGTRATEGAVFVIAVATTAAFIPLSREFIAAGSPDASHFQTTAEVLLESADVTYALGQTVFAIGATMLYYLLWQSRLIPQWMSLWGLVASPLFVVASLSLLWTGDPNSTLSTVLYVPMGIQEMVMALWLVFKGFNSAALKEARTPSLA
jgi:magnesium-transporting ATPase (P-type)